jgi:hypothetical protein
MPDHGTNVRAKGCFGSIPLKNSDKGVANSYVSQTILTNIRVLAIGPNNQAKMGSTS